MSKIRDYTIWHEKEKKINLDSLTIEVTRKCNLKCEHCMRGEPQDITITPRIIDRAFEQIEMIDKIHFTGGEPFLVPEVLEYIVNYIIKNKKNYKMMSAVINGTILDDRAIRILKELDRYAEYAQTLFENRYGQKETLEQLYWVHIIISNSPFHKNDIEKAISFYTEHIKSSYVTVGVQEYDYKALYDSGRATTLKTDLPLFCEGFCHRLLIEDNIVKCGIQLNANGNLSLHSSNAFEYVDKHSMGNILKKPISCLMTDWEWQEPISCLEMERYYKAKTYLKRSNNERAKIYIDFIDWKRKTMQAIHEAYPYFNINDVEELFYYIADDMVGGRLTETCLDFGDTFIPSQYINLLNQPRKEKKKRIISANSLNVQRVIEGIIKGNIEMGKIQKAKIVDIEPFRIERLNDEK